MTEIVAFAIGAATFGATFGVVATAQGVPAPKAVAASAIVFGGSAQFAALALMASGASGFAAVVGGLLLQSRFLLLCLAASRRLPYRGWRRLAAAGLSSDPAVALVLTEPDPHRVGSLYWRSALVIFCSWVGGTLVGAQVGSLVPDPRVLGLDAALPVLLLALLWPMLGASGAIATGASAAVLSVLGAPFLPPGMPLVAGLLGVVVGVRQQRRLREREGTPCPGA